MNDKIGKRRKGKGKNDEEGWEDEDMDVDVNVDVDVDGRKEGLGNEESVGNGVDSVDMVKAVEEEIL